MFAFRRLPAAALAVIAGSAAVLGGAALASPSASAATTSAVVSDRVLATQSSAMSIGSAEQEAKVAYRYVTRKVCKRSHGHTHCRRVTTRYHVTRTAPVKVTTAAKRALATSPSYSFLGTDTLGNPAHYDRCTPVRYRVNIGGAPSTFSADLSRALGQLSAASGVTFTYAGTTSVVPYSTADWTSRTPGDAELYVAWTTPTAVPALAGSTAGIGGNAYGWASGQLPRITISGVSLDSTAKLPAGFGTGATTGALLLHELGHATNLAHVSDQRQVMYPTLTSLTRPAYQAGDLAGLSKLKSYPCF